MDVGIEEMLAIARAYVAEDDSEHRARSNCRAHRRQVCSGIAGDGLVGPLKNHRSGNANHLALALDGEANHTLLGEVSVWVCFGSISWGSFSTSWI
jgi:hypothetical protein